MKAIILAAGGGSRLAPIGITIPKVLVSITGKPILDHHIAAVAPYVDEVIVVIGPNDFGRQIQQYIQNSNWPIPINTAIQEKPLGTANAYQAAAQLISGQHRLLCLNGDDLYSPQDLKRLMEYEYAILGQPVTDPEKWGILNTDETGKLEQLVEKPSQFMGYLAYTGAALLSTEIFNLYHHVKQSSRGEYEFTETVTAFAQQEHIQVIEVANYWLPIGYPWQILDAHQKLTVQPIIGNNVRLGQNVSVLGSSVIGDNVTIGGNVTISDSTVFSGATINSHNKVSHSIIGQNAKLGSNLTIKTTATGSPTVHSDVKDKPLDTMRQHFGLVLGDNGEIGDAVTIEAGCKIWPGIHIPSGITVDQDVTS